MKNKPVKGKVPHADWPAIILRHERGELLSEIADDYGCTAPAISYILRRARSKKTDARASGAGSGDTAARHKPAPQREQPQPAESIVEAAKRLPGKGTRDLTAGPSFPRELRKQISDDIASFVVALDSAIAEPTTANVDFLLDASERLMQAAARARIEGARLRIHQDKPSGKPSRRLPIVGDAPSRRM